MEWLKLFKNLRNRATTLDGLAWAEARNLLKASRIPGGTLGAEKVGAGGGREPWNWKRSSEAGKLDGREFRSMSLKLQDLHGIQASEAFWSLELSRHSRTLVVTSTTSALTPTRATVRTAKNTKSCQFITRFCEKPGFLKRFCIGKSCIVMQIHLVFSF